MEREINTNLGHLIVSTIYKGKEYELEKLLVYHRRSLEDESDVFSDYIYFTSPERCNLYGSKLTRIENYNSRMKKDNDTFILQKGNDLYYIHRLDYMKISGLIDFLIYHRFKTSSVILSKTLDDKENFENAIKDAKEIIQVLYSDLMKLKFEHCKIKLQFKLYVEPEKH